MRLASGHPRKLMPLLKSAVGVLKLGQKDVMDLLRVGPSAVEDWLGEYFESRVLRATLEMSGLLGTWMSPRSPSSAGMLLIAEAMAGEEVVGGPARLINALIAVCRASGVSLETDATVKSIEIENGEVKGVTLLGGRALSAPVVLSTIGPQPTLLSLIDPSLLPGGLDVEVMNIRARGTMAKVHLGLAGPLSVRSRPGEVFERLQVAEDPDDYERAFDDVRFGRMPALPPLDIRMPSVGDPSLSPDGHHVVSVAVHSAPYDLKGGWDDRARDRLFSNVVASLSRYAPEVRDMIVAHEVVTPADLEQRYGVVNGHPHHAELSLDQLWAMRPTPSLSGYATPLRGLYLGVSRTSPGWGGDRCTGSARRSCDSRPVGRPLSRVKPTPANAVC